MTMTSPDTCRDIVAHISAYLDGELERAACEAIERHCGGCARCATLVTGLRESIGLCRQAGAAPLPHDVRERARRNLERLLAEESART